MMPTQWKLIFILLASIGLLSTSLLKANPLPHSHNNTVSDQPSSQSATQSQTGNILVKIIHQPPLLMGQPATITFSLQDALTNSPITLNQLQTNHTQKIHALIIDPTLTDYHHKHPQPGKKPGEYTFTFTPLTPNNYRIWLDIQPIQGKQQYLITDVYGKNKINPPIIKQLATSAYVNHYQFDLNFTPSHLRVNHDFMGSLMVKDKFGKPVTQLEPIMEAFAHIVAFNEDYRTILHVHPMGKEPTDLNERSGPQVDFHLSPSQSGFVKVFAQVQINRQEIIAPFGIEVDTQKNQ